MGGDGGGGVEGANVLVGGLQIGVLFCLIFFVLCQIPRRYSRLLNEPSVRACRGFLVFFFIACFVAGIPPALC